MEIPTEPGFANSPATSGTSPERRTSLVELLWDLVFVFAVTQVTARLAHRPG